MISSAVLLLAMISQPAPPRLHVALAFDAGATPAFEAAVAEEAARVWAPYGIALDESPEDSPCHSGTITLHVAMAQTPDRGANPHALGSIVFTGGAPKPRISLCCDCGRSRVGCDTQRPVALACRLPRRDPQSCARPRPRSRDRTLPPQRAKSFGIGADARGTAGHRVNGVPRHAPRAVSRRRGNPVQRPDETWPEPAVGASRLPAGSRGGSKLERQGR
jgi:hypothetical protein